MRLTVHFVPAVLAAGAPEQAAFMSDEAMESVPGLKPIQYTAKHYTVYLEKMTERTEKINRGNDTKLVTSSSAVQTLLIKIPHWPVFNVLF